MDEPWAASVQFLGQPTVSTKACQLQMNDIWQEKVTPSTFGHWRSVRHAKVRICLIYGHELGTRSVLRSLSSIPGPLDSHNEGLPITNKLLLAGKGRSVDFWPPEDCQTCEGPHPLDLWT